ncbi:FtsX-like permease family protein [Parasedimentitalea marina]|uniref:FtsX-like permease family protein n=1 Tax=Parasedimentitalea marina TaxID=2483033 RepID=A0A3T0N4C6_9RHOB|nr:ABC transporter permease [Parasedimentitalea marina]AZV78832.1 FtsX-like permease family protein [Parasedimentitalea marina]
MASTPPPFARFEWMIAWRYLRARRAEGGVSVMTWISLIGITLAVFALVATLAVREGLRSDLIQTMLGANAHAEIHYRRDFSAEIPVDHLIRNYGELVETVGSLPEVTLVSPLVRGQVMGSYRGRNLPVDVFGITLNDLQNYPKIAASQDAVGDLSRFNDGVAIGAMMARQLGVGIGDRIKLISPNGVKTPMGTSPRVSAYEVVYIFSSGQGFVDQSRLYLPLAEAQSFFNREGAVDQLDLRLNDPEQVAQMVLPLLRSSGERAYVTTWQDRAGGMIQALKMQDNAIFIVLSILVLIAALNIVSGLIMLVKNKGRDIGILRTMGLSQGSILRVFFLCGASVGTLGTLFGVILGVVFAANIDSIYGLVDWITGSGVRDLEANGFFFPSAVVTFGDVSAAAGLSLGLSWLITVFPARRAARMNPVEALRYE